MNWLSSILREFWLEFLSTLHHAVLTELTVPPEPPTNTRTILNAKREFERQLVEFRLPNPTGKLFEIEMIGDCLDPLIKNGDRCWLDPSRAAKDGDIIAMDYDENEWDVVTEKKEAFESKFGNFPEMMTKFLYSAHGAYWFTDNVEAWPFEGCQCGSHDLPSSLVTLPIAKLPSTLSSLESTWMASTNEPLGFVLYVAARVRRCLSTAPSSPL